MSATDLNKRELGRLEEIAKAESQRWGYQKSYAGHARTTTLRLRELGLIEIQGEQIAKTGRMMALGRARLTDAGRAAIAEATSPTPQREEA